MIYISRWAPNAAVCSRGNLLSIIWRKAWFFMRTDWSRDKQMNVWAGKKPLSVVTARWISAENCEIQRTTKTTRETNVEMSAGPSCPVNMTVYSVFASCLWLPVSTFVVKQRPLVAAQLVTGAKEEVRWPFHSVNHTYVHFSRRWFSPTVVRKCWTNWHTQGHFYHVL